MNALDPKDPKNAAAATDDVEAHSFHGGVPGSKEVAAPNRWSAPAVDDEDDVEGHSVHPDKIDQGDSF